MLCGAALRPLQALALEQSFSWQQASGQAEALMVPVCQRAAEVQADLQSAGC